MSSNNSKLPPSPNGGAPTTATRRSIWDAFTFDITQEEDLRNGFEFQPQVQDGWRSYNLASYRTDKHKEFVYWLRQALAINPSILGVIQLAGMLFAGSVPRWAVYSLYTMFGLTSPWTIIAGVFFVASYGSITLIGLKTRDLTIPTAVRLLIGITGAIVL